LLFETTFEPIQSSDRASGAAAHARKTAAMRFQRNGAAQASELISVRKKRPTRGLFVF
jgi:hypothetical protein